MKLDKIDRRILQVLQKEGRLSNVQLAEKVGMSPSPVLERVRKLENGGVIRGYVSILDRSAVEINLIAFVTVSVDLLQSDPYDRFAADAAEMPEVLECHRLAEGARFLLKVAARDLADFERFLTRVLSPIPVVRDLRSTVVLSTVKEGMELPVAGALESPPLDK